MKINLTTKKCMFCDTAIKNHFYTCTKHVKWYYEYKDEVWFKDLLVSEKKQRYIDHIELAAGLTILPRTKPTYTHETRGKKSILPHNEIIRLKRTKTFKELAIQFNCSVSAIREIIYRKAPYLRKKRTKK